MMRPQPAVGGTLVRPVALAGWRNREPLNQEGHGLSGRAESIHEKVVKLVERIDCKCPCLVVTAGPACQEIIDAS